MQAVCGVDLDLLCNMMGLQMCWLELKRQLVTRGLGREGQFSLFDLVGEIAEQP